MSDSLMVEEVPDDAGFDIPVTAALDQVYEVPPRLEVIG
jgi:hypothetical protein